jgi:cbb3-type cytochrome oxidase subunit 3
MRKFIKGISYIIVALLVLGGIMLYLLSPSKKAEIDYSESKTMTIEDIVKKSNIGSMEILKNPTRLKGEVNIGNKDLKDIVYTVLLKSGVDELMYNEVEIVDDSIAVKVPYKVMGFIQTQVDFELIPEIQGEDLIFEIKDIHIGKIPISNSLFEKSLDYIQANKDFRIKDNKIIVDKSYVYPAKLNKVTVKDNKLNLDLEMEIGSVLDFLNNGR